MMKKISFNQSGTSLALATVSGFSLYNLNEIDTVLRVSHKGTKEKFEIEKKAKVEEIFLIERHYSESIVALVPESQRSRLVLWDFGKGKSFPEKDKINPILAVKFHQRNVIIFFESEILMHNMDHITFADHHKQHNITPNPTAIHAVAYESKDYGFIAVPYKDDDDQDGQVEIFDTVHWRRRGVFSLHSTPVEALAFNPPGTRLASASKSDKSGMEMSTVIRIYSVNMEYVGDIIKAVTKELFEFRHKYFINESIQSLLFSSCAQFIVANTNGTSIYVYSLDDDENCSKTTKIDVTGSVVVKKLEKDKTFKKDTKVESKICAVTTCKDQLRVVIVTSDLCLSVYNIPSCLGEKYTCLGYYDLTSDILDDSSDTNNPITIKAKLLGYTIYEASAMYNPRGYDKKFFKNQAKNMKETVKRTVKFKDECCSYSDVNVSASTSDAGAAVSLEAEGAAAINESIFADDGAATASTSAASISLPIPSSAAIPEVDVTATTTSSTTAASASVASTSAASTSAASTFAASTSAASASVASTSAASTSDASTSATVTSAASTSAASTSAASTSAASTSAASTSTSADAQKATAANTSSAADAAAIAATIAQLREWWEQ